MRFIEQIRAYYETRYAGKGAAEAPFVIATIGFGGTTYTPGTAYGDIWQAQMNVGDSSLYPDLNSKTVNTLGYWRSIAESPKNEDFHYNTNAETYTLVGDALARTMIDMQGGVTPPTGDYETWAAAYPGADLANPNDDFDGDGQTNNEERLWGLDPTDGASVNPISVPLDATTGTLTYTRRNTELSGASHSYQWSTTLDEEGWTTFTPASEIASGASPVETVTITLDAALLTNPKLFVRVVAAQD